MPSAPRRVHPIKQPPRSSGLAAESGHKRPPAPQNQSDEFRPEARRAPVLRCPWSRPVGQNVAVEYRYAENLAEAEKGHTPGRSENQFRKTVAVSAPPC